MTRAEIEPSPGDPKRSFRATVADLGPLVAIGRSLKAGARRVGAGARRIGAVASRPLVASSMLASGLVGAGFAAIYLGWRGAAASLAVGVQITYLASGGVAGFALLLAGLGILSAQLSRHLAARERVELDEAVARASEALAAATQGRPRSRSGL